MIDEKHYILILRRIGITKIKKTIADRNGVSIFAVQMIARGIARKTGLTMRVQRSSAPITYTEDFIKELKAAYQK